MRKLILALDFNNVLFGSYYSEKLLNSKGININAINAFFFRLKMFKETFNPDYIIMANDISRAKTFRRNLYKPYKANRKPMDEDILTQFKYTSQILSLMGYPFINNELYEADDILGMISKYATDNDMDVIIISSDKDLYQLLNDNTYILSPRKNELIDINWLNENYRLTPQQWIEMKILQGDAGDNIPGVKGVGEVTAVKLLQEYGTIENIYKHLNQLKWQTKDNLLAFQETLPLIRTLVTIITDYSIINLKEESFELKERYENEIFSLINELELYSISNIIRYSLMSNKVYGEAV